MLGLWKLVHFHKHLDNKDLIIVISHCYLLSLRSYWTSVACQLRNLFGGKLTAVLEVGTRGGWDQKGLSVLVNQAGGLANSAAWTEPRDRGTTHHVPLRSSFWCLQVDGCSGGDLFSSWWAWLGSCCTYCDGSCCAPCVPRPPCSSCGSFLQNKALRAQWYDCVGCWW